MGPSQPSPAARRLRPLALIPLGLALGLPLLLFLMSYAPNREVTRLLRGDVNRLVSRDASGWHQLDAPGIPYEIQAGSGSEIWVASYAPFNLSRWSGGKWTHFGDHDVSGGFAASAGQLYTAGPKRIERFDGRDWHTLPVSLPNPISIAADGSEVWAIDRFGTLAHCAGNQCETHSLKDQIPIFNVLDNHGGRLHQIQHRGWRNRILVRTPGRLWLVYKSAWYSADGRQWTKWKVPWSAWAWALGYSGGRLWIRTQDDILAIGDDLAATTFPRDDLVGTTIRGIHAAESAPITLAGGNGLYERIDGKWRGVPVDPGLHAESISGFARTPDGGLWLIASRKPSLTRAFTFGGLVVIGLIALNFSPGARKVSR